MPREGTLALLGGEPAVSIPPPHYRWPIIERDDIEAVTQQLVNGPLSFQRNDGVVREFEQEFAAKLRLPYAVSTNSGTAALHAAYFGLGLQPGDEVIAPTYTHIASVLPMLHVGLIPVLCDVDENTGNIDAGEIEQHLSPRTRAIVVTHQYGHICDMDAVVGIARTHGLKIVEDCSHAHGATYRGVAAGSFGDVACFSLQAHKTVTAGEGGILVTKDAGIFERAALLGHFREPTEVTSQRYVGFASTGYGFKSRLHPLGAALALSQLRKMDRIMRARHENLAYFGERIRGIAGVALLITYPDYSRGGYYRYVLKYEPSELPGVTCATYMRALAAEGVAELMPGNRVIPLHCTKIFQTLEDGMYATGWPRKGPHVSRELTYRLGDFPRAEQFSALTLQFPAFTEPSKHVIDAYCNAMEKVAVNSSALRRLEQRAAHA